MGQYDKNNDLIVYYKTCSKDLARRNKRVAKMTLTVDAAQRQSMVPLQQSASSGLARAFGYPFVTGSQPFSLYFL